MRNLLSLAIALALPFAASADDQRCMVSFSGAQHDVCENRVYSDAVDLDVLLSTRSVQDSSLRIVKFDGPILGEQRQALELLGASIVGYAPYNAFIVRMPASLDTDAMRIEGVVWSGPMLPALKVDPNIFAELRQGNIARELGVDSLSIALDGVASRNAVLGTLSSIASLSGIEVFEVAGEQRATARYSGGAVGLRSAVEALALRDDVLSVGFRKPMQAFNSQGHWLHQGNVNAQHPIWDKGIYGCGQIVGELDTGLYVGNVAFNDPSQTLAISVCNSGPSCAAIAANNDHRKVVAYYKWSGASGGSWADGHGHGTHVAGSIMGNDNGVNPGQDCSTLAAPNGASNLVGMAPYAKLVMQEAGSGLDYLNDYNGTTYHAVDTAYQNGARIHSNSWGGGCTNQFGLCVSGCTVPYDEFSRDADRVAKDRGDVLVVFAAGNDATACPSGNNVGSPGNSKNVLSIAATGRGTAGNNMAGFSSRGPALDSRTKPDLGAQGNGIVSASRSANGTTSMSGTSMATPTASGLAALVRDYLAQGYYPSGMKTASDAITAPSGALLKAILTAGAVKMTGSGAGANPGQAQGFGRILLDDSLYFDGDASHLFIHDDEDGLGLGAVDEHSLLVSAGAPLTVVLTWTDAAGAINASPATVNSLRLEVEAPNGDVWTQKLPAAYNVNNANPTQDTGTSNYDNLNNLHRIRLDTPQAGLYQIRVRGINVPQGPQSYALAAVGDFTVDVGPTYNVGGQVSGAVGPGLSLKLNNGTDLPIVGNGAYTFPNVLPDGASYTVSVTSLPVSQTCQVANGSGTINGADVTNVDVTCITVPSYTVGGTASGVAAAGLVLQLNGGGDLPVSADGNFTFAGVLIGGTPYAVTIAAQPAGQECVVANGSGTVTNANVTDVAVTCITIPTYSVGGTANGTGGPGLMLKLNGGTPLAVGGDVAFTFPDELFDGESYVVSVGTAPAGKNCSVAYGSGSIVGADVTNVEVNCADIPPQPYLVGGSISGLAGTVVLQLNGGLTVTRSTNGRYNFVPGVSTGETYEVTVSTQPAGQLCTVANATGTMAHAPVSDVNVSCITQPTEPEIFADGFEM